MLKFIASRTLHSLISLLVISLIVFSLSHLTGSPVDALLPDDATPEQISNLIAHLGLDRPLYIQYLTFLDNAVVGDFGQSTKWKGTSAADAVLQRLPATLQLGGFAMLISVIVAIPMGVLSEVPLVS